MVISNSYVKLPEGKCNGGSFKTDRFPDHQALGLAFLPLRQSQLNHLGSPNNYDIFKN